MLTYVSSLDRFCGIGNLSFQSHAPVACSATAKTSRNAPVRANGLRACGVLGLLSGMVGLLRSCVDYQEVILSLDKHVIRGSVDVSH